MADHISDVGLDFVEVSLKSELDYLRKLSSTVLDEIEQIIIVSLLQSERQEDEREKFEEDFDAWAETLSLDDWDCEDQPEGNKEVENSVHCEVQKKCQHQTSSDSESSSSDALKLKISLIKESENAKTGSVGQNSSDCTWPTTTTSAPSHQSDVPPTIEKQRVKIDAESDAPTTTEKQRVKIDAEKLPVLERVFATSKYIIGKKRRELAVYLGLSEKQVGNWFEYRRRRMRRMQSETSKNKKAGSARSARPLKNIDTSITMKQEPLDKIVSMTPDRLLQNSYASSTVKRDKLKASLSTKLSLDPKQVDISFMVKSKCSDLFVSPVSTWPPDPDDALFWENQNPFDLISTCSSDPSRARDLEFEDTQSPNDEYGLNSFRSTTSIEIPPFEQSLSSEDIPSWPGHLEENYDFSYPHAAGEDNLLSVMGLDDIFPNTLSSFE